MADFEAFMQKVMQRSLPNNGMARIRMLARELAEGATEEVWQPSIVINVQQRTIEGKSVQVSLVPHESIQKYLEIRWGNQHPDLILLRYNGYLERRTDNNTVHEITEKAFLLVDEVEPSTIFISYRRKESSAFALLVLARLKEHGLKAFLDMSIQAGNNWHAHIKEQIGIHGSFIVILNHETLDSEAVCNEIQWAMDAKKAILPVAHPKFEYVEYKKLRTDEGKFNLTPEMDFMLTNTHTIRVLEESALAYNNAIVELLNRFGITP
jgi:hypothetical protein